MNLPTNIPCLQQDSTRERSHHRLLSLDLSLSNEDMAEGSSFCLIPTELNLLDTFDDAAKEAAEPRVFSCNYCQRKFFNSQALGGHQNAHSRERDVAKTGRKYSTLSSLPLHGFCRSLGVQTHSLIRKPSSHASKFHRQPLYAQVAAGQLLPGSFRSGEGGRKVSTVVVSWFDRYSKRKHKKMHNLDCLDLSLRL